MTAGVRLLAGERLPDRDELDGCFCVVVDLHAARAAGPDPRRRRKRPGAEPDLIDIELNDGRTVSGRADFGKGSPVNPMSDAELADKFRECAAWGRLPDRQADKVIDMVFGLEKLKSVRELMRLVAPARSAPLQTRVPSRI